MARLFTDSEASSSLDEMRPGGGSTLLRTTATSDDVIGRRCSRRTYGDNFVLMTSFRRRRRVRAGRNDGSSARPSAGPARVPDTAAIIVFFYPFILRRYGDKARSLAGSHWLPDVGRRALLSPSFNYDVACLPSSLPVLSHLWTSRVTWSGGRRRWRKCFKFGEDKWQSCLHVTLYYGTDMLLRFQTKAA